MVNCWRCGVDFDATLYKSDAPCEDCQLDVPGQWLKNSGQRVKMDARSVIAREERVRELNALKWWDTQIAEELDISPGTVYRIRKRLGLPVVYDSEKNLWKDREAQVAHAKQMVTHRKQAKRGYKIINFEGSFQRDSRGKKVGDD